MTMRSRQWGTLTDFNASTSNSSVTTFALFHRCKTQLKVRMCTQNKTVSERSPLGSIFFSRVSQRGPKMAILDQQELKRFDVATQRNTVPKACCPSHFL